MKKICLFYSGRYFPLFYQFPTLEGSVPRYLYERHLLRVNGASLLAKLYQIVRSVKLTVKGWYLTLLFLLNYKYDLFYLKSNYFSRNYWFTIEYNRYSSSVQILQITAIYFYINTFSGFASKLFKLELHSLKKYLVKTCPSIIFL